MTPLYTKITNELIPSILSFMPKDCDGQVWNVKSEGVCSFTRRTDERQEYLYGPIWPHNAARNFVTLEDNYDAQIAVVVDGVDTPEWFAAGTSQRVSNNYSLSVVVAGFHSKPTLFDRVEKALTTNQYGGKLIGINADTLRNAARFYRPDSDQMGLDPERAIFVYKFNVSYNFNVSLSELEKYE